MAKLEKNTGGGKTCSRGLFLAISLVVALVAAPKAADTLDIYFIDVEGGQSTLIVTPTGETLLVDAGFPSAGTFESKPGDPARARDAQRILAAARAAGVSRINYLLLTHFHADHDGGVPELAQLAADRHFRRPRKRIAAAETTSAGTLRSVAPLRGSARARPAPRAESGREDTPAKR